MHVLHNSIEFLFAATALASLSLRVSVFFLRAPGYSAILLLVSFIYTLYVSTSSYNMS